MIEEGKPIFVQIAEQIENDIIDGVYPAETQVPSTNEFAAFYRINPATAGKGVNLLVDDGILYKKRGIGMFVADGARERLIAKRRDAFRDEYLRPLLAEAAKLGIDPEQLTADDRHGRSQRMTSHSNSDVDRAGRPASTGSPSASVVHRHRRRQLHRQARTRSTACSAATARARPPSCSCSPGRTSPPRGEIRVFGEKPVENARVLQNICFIKESQRYPDDFMPKHVFRSAPWFFENWDAEFAEQLIDEFRLPLNRRIKKLSRGQLSAVGVIVGLASRAPLTFFDEPYLGLDAVARQIFYDRLLEDYAEHPRTVVLSTHLIDEVANLLEHVIVIDQGRILIDEDAETLRGSATTVVGQRGAVDAFVAGRDVLHRDGIGGLASVTVGALEPRPTGRRPSPRASSSRRSPSSNSSSARPTSERQNSSRAHDRHHIAASRDPPHRARLRAAHLARRPAEPRQQVDHHLGARS